MRRSILVVDDDEAIRAAISEALAVAGHSALCEATAEDALGTLDSHPDTELAIVDVNLPGTDGFGFLERAKVLHPSLRVMLMTGLPTHEVRSRAWQHGALAVMDKPVMADELSVKIEGALA